MSQKLLFSSISCEGDTLMVYTKWLIIALFTIPAFTADVVAGERAGWRDAPTVPGKLAHSGRLAARNGDPPAPLARGGGRGGGVDRFDALQSRAIGRAYLLQLYGRYGNWPDAIAAYNWGIGKMDAWVKAGRPPDQFLVGVAAYLRRVLHESGLCNGAETGRHRQPSEEASEPASAPPDSL